MRHASKLAVLWIWCAAAAWAADPTPPIVGPAEVKRDEIAVLTINLPDDVNTKSTVRRLTVPAGLKVVKADDGKKWYVAGKPGVYTIAGEVFVRRYDKDGRIQDFDFIDIDYSIRVVDPDPPPVPPGPNPPDPPGPTPGPAPIAIDGLACVVVIDDMANNLTADQINTISGGEWADYMRANAATDKTGQKAWRLYKKSNTVTDDDSALKAAFDAAKDKALPWIVVSNPKKGGGESVPLPKTKADILALLKKYGG